VTTRTEHKTDATHPQPRTDVTAHQRVLDCLGQAKIDTLPPVSEWLRSLPTPEAVAALVGARYGLNVRSCVLLRSLANEVYQLGTDEAQYVLKLYRHGGWSADEVAWEQDLVVHVINCGVACPPPVPLLDGRLCGELAAPEGTRPFALAEYVSGTKPQPPASEALYQDFGRLIGRFHEAGASFRTSHPRRAFDLNHLLDEPLRAITPYLAGHADKVTALADQARQQLSTRELSWGVQHGDVTLDNVHRTDRGLVLHDFDLAGPGWLAADLAGVHATRHWPAFAAGYAAVRTLPEMSALPWLEVCALLSNLRFHMIEKPLYRGLESLTEGWVDRELARIDELARQLC
jgi:Ser/Thr protein kinase RdoA (MazF antagonist)